MRPNGTFFIPMHHPRGLFASQTYAFAMVSDWEKAVRIQKEGPTRIGPHFEEWQWRPALADVKWWFHRTIDGSDPGPWSVDFEGTVNGEPVCLALWSAYNPDRNRGICVPILCQGGGDYWTPEEWAEVLAILTDFFTDPRRGKFGHNLVGYDTGLCEPGAAENWNKRGLLKKAWGIDIQGVVVDTMAAHHLCYSELRMNLAFCASLVTDLPPFKLEVWEGGDDADDDAKAKPDWVYILERPDIKTRCYCLSDNIAQAFLHNHLVEVMA